MSVGDINATIDFVNWMSDSVDGLECMIECKACGRAYNLRKSFACPGCGHKPSNE